MPRASADEKHILGQDQSAATEITYLGTSCTLKNGSPEKCHFLALGWKTNQRKEGFKKVSIKLF